MTGENMFEIKPNFAETLIIVLTVALVAVAPLKAGQFDPALYAGMQWRLVGPFRAGRVSAVAGVTRQPGVYYMASPGGGVWKTTGGPRWEPTNTGMLNRIPCIRSGYSRATMALQFTAGFEAPG